MKIPILGVILLTGITSCGTYMPPVEKAAHELSGNSLTTADALMERANRILTDDRVAAVYQLRAAEIAWQQLDTDGGVVKDVSRLSTDQRHALRIISSATRGITENFIGTAYQPEKEFSYGGYSYLVSLPTTDQAGAYPLSNFESITCAEDVRKTLCENWHTEEGVGVPYAPKWKRPNHAGLHRFFTSRGFLQPITTVMNFEGAIKSGKSRNVSIRSYDTTQSSSVTLGGTTYPLAADFTAPIVEQTQDINEFSIALTGLIHPGVLDSKLILLEPYDPKRIPLLLVHGLNSHPRMWRDVLNDLRADPMLRGKYQFMLFYYPTAWPITYSSMRLREELHAFQKAVGPTRKMVLVGHSMGGLLSRMQVINPDRKIWDAHLGKDADRYFSKLPAHSPVKRSTLFSADPQIGREVYICTPHRGSSLADLSLTSWFIKIVKLPTNITSAFIDLPGNLIERGQLTSVAGLSPSNPLYKALEELPIEVPHHSIIGDRGRGNAPEGGDGVVPYRSAHLKSAQSELIVPKGHGAFDHPLAIQELRRILLLHARVRN